MTHFLSPQLLLIFLLVVAIPAARSQLADASTLLEHVLHSYDKRVRPAADSGNPVLVHLTIVLGILTELVPFSKRCCFIIGGLGDIRQIIKQVESWLDPKLTWDPARFGGQKTLIMPKSLVWIPKLFIYNSMETKEMLSDERYDVSVRHDGIVKINMPQFVTVICRLDISIFPFDTQFCAVAIASPLLTVRDLDVNATQVPEDSYFTGNAEWSVLNITVRQMRFKEQGEERVEVHYIFHMRRRAAYYIHVIVAPIFLISALSILGIFSPGSNDGPRNEKVSLGLGSLLAMTVLLDIVSGAMPKSDSIPLLGVYIIAVIVLCAAAVALSTCFLALSRTYIQSGRLPTRRIYCLFGLRAPPIQTDEKCVVGGPLRRTRLCDRWTIRPLHRRWSRSTSPISPIAYESDKVLCALSTVNTLLRHHLSLTGEISQVLENRRRLTERTDWQTKVTTEWNRVFSRFDLIAFVFVEVLNLLCLLWFLRNALLPNRALPDDFAV